MLNSISVPILINHDESKETVKTLGLLDSGAGGQFINRNYARKEGFEIKKLDKPLWALNVDGTKNKRGTITSFVELNVQINGEQMNLCLLVTGLGKQKIILSFPWLHEYNPEINWKTGDFTWRKAEKPWRHIKIKRRHTCQPLLLAKKLARQALNQIEEETDKEERKNWTINPMPEGTDILIDEIDEEKNIGVLTAWTEEMEDEVWINTKTSNSIEFQLQHGERKEGLSLEEQIPKEYHEYLDVFDEDKADQFPSSRPWDHKIELKEGFQPKSFKSYNLTPEEQTELDKFLKDNLEKEYIWLSQSLMASPFFFVKKKDGKLRPCQDYQYLNEWTIKNAYPLPLILELTDKIKDAKFFTKLDVHWGYNNVRIKDGDQWKASFKTNKGLFKPTVMFFGMCNSPATFQAMMDSIFQDLMDACIVIIYMDDIFLFAKDRHTLEVNMKKVLQRLWENDLYLKPKKCEFGKMKIEWLGMIIEEGRISMDSGKLWGIKEWPVPTTMKQVQGFLRFGNFYRQFIRHFSEIAKPLNDLLKKDWKFEWTEACQNSFDELSAWKSGPVWLLGPWAF